MPTQAQQPEVLTRSIEAYPAYDKRAKDPAKNYGIGSVTLKFLLKGRKGTIQFVILTGWYLPKVQEEHKAKGWTTEPMASDIGYHAPVPQYEGQNPMTSGACEYLGGPCYYDGSGLQAERVFKKLIEGGHEAMWKEMEERYETLSEVSK